MNHCKPLGEPCADLSTGGCPKGFMGLAQANRHPCPGFHKGWEPFREDLSWTIGTIAEELAHMQDELHAEACTWQIGYHASIVAMATFGWTATERTASSLFR